MVLKPPTTTMRAKIGIKNFTLIWLNGFIAFAFAFPICSFVYRADFIAAAVIVVAVVVIYERSVLGQNIGRTSPPLSSGPALFASLALCLGLPEFINQSEKPIISNLCSSTFRAANVCYISLICLAFSFFIFFASPPFLLLLLFGLRDLYVLIIFYVLYFALQVFDGWLAQKQTFCKHCLCGQRGWEREGGREVRKKERECGLRLRHIICGITQLSKKPWKGSQMSEPSCSGPVGGAH